MEQLAELLRWKPLVCKTRRQTPPLPVSVLKAPSGCGGGTHIVVKFSRQTGEKSKQMGRNSHVSSLHCVAQPPNRGFHVPSDVANAHKTACMSPWPPTGSFSKILSFAEAAEGVTLLGSTWANGRRALEGECCE